MRKTQLYTAVLEAGGWRASIFSWLAWRVCFVQATETSNKKMLGNAEALIFQWNESAQQTTKKHPKIMVGRAQGLTWWNSKAKGGVSTFKLEKAKKNLTNPKKKVHCFCHIRTHLNHAYIFFFTNTFVGVFRRDSKYSMLWGFYLLDF